MAFWALHGSPGRVETPSGYVVKGFKCQGVASLDSLLGVEMGCRFWGLRISNLASGDMLVVVGCLSGGMAGCESPSSRQRSSPYCGNKGIWYIGII